MQDGRFHKIKLSDLIENVRNALIDLVHLDLFFLMLPSSFNSAQVVGALRSGGPAFAINAGYCTGRGVGLFFFKLLQDSKDNIDSCICHKACICNALDLLSVSQSVTAATLKCNRQGRGRCDYYNACRRAASRRQAEQIALAEIPKKPARTYYSNLQPFVDFMNAGLNKHASSGP